MLLFLELTNKGEAITISTSIKLPVGIENFEEIRTGGYYYVDKTKLIKQLFASGGKVNLFTRPRRFGKTLNMSMLNCFFPINMQTGEICLKDLISGKIPGTGRFRAHILFYISVLHR